MYGNVVDVVLIGGECIDFVLGDVVVLVVLFEVV